MITMLIVAFRDTKDWGGVYWLMVSEILLEAIVLTALASA
jgi:hypothetical protein